MCLVTVSKSSSASKKSSSKQSSTKSKVTTPETTASPAPAHVSAAPTDAVATTSTGAMTAAAPKPASNSTLASKTIAQLDAIEAALGLDIVIAPNDKKQIGALNRVSDTAIGLASDIVSADPTQFPGFADLPAAASYVETIGQVGARAQELATHVRNSVLNQRAPAATKTLALYAVVKGLGRITANETMREKVTALKAEVAPKRHDPKPKVTKGQKAVTRVAKAKAKKVAKAMDLLTSAGALPTAATPVATATVTPAAVSNGVTPTNGAAQAAPVAGH